jgi:ribose 1,5-bisphosphokinase PhnN
MSTFLRQLFSAFPTDDADFFKMHNNDFRLRETREGFVAVRRADGLSFAITNQEFVAALDRGIDAILNGPRAGKK